MTVHIQEIALSKLVPSKANVRRTGRAERIDELAASIAAHGLLQNLTVKATTGERFEVIAGGRRLAALKLLMKQKQVGKDMSVPCQIVEGDNVTELSLAENALQCPMHPADQFEAFAALQRQQMGVEDIAARFGVSPLVVAQRLKLGAVSPTLMDVYRAGEMNLDQLSAFAITDDHEQQERVWGELGYDRSRRAILSALNADRVSSEDRRAVYVGAEAYLAAGGHITRDLFGADGSGFFDDAALLNRLVNDKLATEAETVKAEGWGWVEVVPEFDYGVASQMRRIYPEPRALSDEEQARVDDLTERYNVLCDESEDDEATEETLRGIDAELDALQNDEIFDPEDKAVAGVFVSLGRNGEARIERGFVRREDDPRRQGGSEGGEAPDEAKKPSRGELPEKLLAELTAQRTAALGNELAQRPDLALVALVHALAAQTFFAHSNRLSCLRVNCRTVYLTGHDKGVGDSRAMTETEARHAAWQQRMPEDTAGLWDFVAALPEADRLALLAHCVSRTVDTVKVPKACGDAAALDHADALAKAIGLDMTAYWQPSTANYLGRVSKAVALRAVREAVSPEAAQTCENLKKPELAARAEKLLAGTGWLPEVLRRPGE